MRSTTQMFRFHYHLLTLYFVAETRETSEASKTLNVTGAQTPIQDVSNGRKGGRELKQPNQPPGQLLQNGGTSHHHVVPRGAEARPAEISRVCKIL